MPFEIYNTDYNGFINILGTVHFTRRSLEEAHYTVRETGTRDLAIELDTSRFSILNGDCNRCPVREPCPAKCEFIGACDALGNVDANIWLIDMSQEEMRRRVRGLMNPWAAASVWRVLMEERNVLMAARLAWITSKRIDEGKKPNVLALVGAAHVRGIRELLKDPVTIRESLQALSLPYSPPTLIRRVGISGGQQVLN